jgi:hypothetical protein
MCHVVLFQDLEFLDDVLQFFPSILPMFVNSFSIPFLYPPPSESQTYQIPLEPGATPPLLLLAASFLREERTAANPVN